MTFFLHVAPPTEAGMLKKAQDAVSNPMVAAGAKKATGAAGSAASAASAASGGMAGKGSNYEHKVKRVDEGGAGRIYDFTAAEAADAERWVSMIRPFTTNPEWAQWDAASAPAPAPAAADPAAVSNEGGESGAQPAASPAK